MTCSIKIEPTWKLNNHLLKEFIYKEFHQLYILIINLFKVYLLSKAVISENELIDLVEIGEMNRTVAATRINKLSSRSHSIFMLDVI